MKPTILNREFKHPADGWYHIERKGNHPNSGSKLVQVIDDKACESIVNRFNQDAADGKLSHGSEMLIDHEHFKHDPEKETIAYGWATKLQQRDDGVYAQIRWTNTGQQAVDGGDYRFFSTEYDPSDLKILNDAKVKSARPLRLDGLTLTNDPNNKGTRPITNRREEDNFAGAGASAANQQKIKNKMKNIATKLGLDAEASESAILTVVDKLLNRADITTDALATLRLEHKNFGDANQTLLGEQVDSILDAHGIKEPKLINRIKPVLLPLKNRQERLEALADLGHKPVEAGKPQTKLLNRETQPPKPGSKNGGEEKDSQAEQQKAQKIMNRARELKKETPSLSDATSVIMAQKEVEAAE